VTLVDLHDESADEADHRDGAAKQDARAEVAGHDEHRRNPPGNRMLHDRLRL
jgi:hypothetical protein